MHGQTVGQHEIFTLPSGETAHFPLDDSLSASECINCRCIIIFVVRSSRQSENYKNLVAKNEDITYTKMYQQAQAENLTRTHEQALVENKVKDAMNEAVKIGKQTGNEALCFISADDGKELIPFETGTSNQVEIPQTTIDFLNNAKKDSVICVHNHPKSNSFSSADMSVMNMFPSIKEMAVKGHDGTEYSLSIGNGSRVDSGTIAAAYTKAIGDLFPKYNSLVVSGKMSPLEASKQHTHEGTGIVADDFGWLYRRG